ncbi:MAG: hypothetical protein KGJ62_08710 [Armatimonadetes bacterium]|nr:hypothetical protein [Armatimonadota bacterium]MDE2205026.1 hypothetical protein [Armatimonadota bacterium]
MLIDAETGIVRQFNAGPASDTLRSQPPHAKGYLSPAASSQLAWRYLRALTGRAGSFGLVLNQLHGTAHRGGADAPVWDALYRRVSGGVPWYDADFANIVIDGVSGRLLRATCLFEPFHPAAGGVWVSQLRAVAVARRILAEHKPGCVLTGPPWAELYFVLARERDARGRLSGYRPPRLAWVVKYPASFGDGPDRQSGYVEVWVAAGSAQIIERTEGRLMGAPVCPPSGGDIGALIRAAASVIVSPAGGRPSIMLAAGREPPYRFFGFLAGVRTASRPSHPFAADFAVTLTSRGGQVNHLSYDSATGLVSGDREGSGALAHAGPAFELLLRGAGRRAVDRRKGNTG